MKIDIYYLKNKNNKNKSEYSSGFTLIELMVSMSIFMIVMLMALGALVSISSTAKKSRAMNHAMDNVNFAMESMTRSLRTGSYYKCGPITTDTVQSPGTSDCDDDGDGAISFVPQLESEQNTGYRLNGTSLEKCSVSSFIECIPMTSSDVIVEDLRFYVTGSDLPAPNPASNTVKAGVYITMKGHVLVREEKNEFALQVFVSQRNSE